MGVFIQNVKSPSEFGFVSLEPFLTLSHPLLMGEKLFLQNKSFIDV